MIFVSSQKALSSEIKTVIKQQLENASNGWTAYRIARQASRMVSENTWRKMIWCGCEGTSDFLELEEERKGNDRTREEEMNGTHTHTEIIPLLIAWDAD